VLVLLHAKSPHLSAYSSMLRLVHTAIRGRVEQHAALVRQSIWKNIMLDFVSYRVFAANLIKNTLVLLFELSMVSNFMFCIKST